MIYMPIIMSALGLAYVFIRRSWVMKQDAGDGKMKEISDHIYEGALAFLNAWPFGNVATEITYQVQSQAFDYLDAPIEKINTADTPAPYSPVLLKEWLPNSEDVIKAVKKVLYK